MWETQQGNLFLPFPVLAYCLLLLSSGSEMLTLATLTLPYLDTDNFPWLAACLGARGAVSEGPRLHECHPDKAQMSSIPSATLLSLGFLHFSDPFWRDSSIFVGGKEMEKGRGILSLEGSSSPWSLSPLAPGLESQALMFFLQKPFLFIILSDLPHNPER